MKCLFVCSVAGWLLGEKALKAFSHVLWMEISYFIRCHKSRMLCHPAYMYYLRCFSPIESFVSSVVSMANILWHSVVCGSLTILLLIFFIFPICQCYILCLYPAYTTIPAPKEAMGKACKHLKAYIYPICF